MNSYQHRRYVDIVSNTDAKEALVLKDAEICFIKPGGK
jgi:hypothetical protein